MNDRPEHVADDELELRIEPLPGYSRPKPAAARTRDLPRGGGRRHGGKGWSRLTVTLLVACAVLLGVLAIGPRQAPRPRATKTPPPTVPALLNVALDASSACIQAVAWAPDGAHLAVWKGLCGQYADTTLGNLAVYDAYTGKLAVDVPLGSPLPTRAKSAGLASTVSPSLTWSPDGQRLALAYVAVQNGGTAQGATDTFALALVRWQSRSVSKYFAAAVAPPSIRGWGPLQQPVSAQAPLPPVPVVRWDIQTGKASQEALPDALGYS